MRRVVVTGMGIVSPLGVGVDHVWKRLLNGDSGAGKITRYDASDLPCQIAAEVPTTEGDEPHLFNVDRYVEKKEQKKMDTFIHYGMAAAQEAIEDSGWMPEEDEDQFRTGVLIGSGIGGLQSIHETSHVLAEKGPRRVSPFFIAGALINLVAGQVSIKYGFKGPNHAIVTACATGTHAIGDAARMIMLDDADVMVCGGAEAAIERLGMAGFAACKALSTQYNDTPEKASRPFDEGRDGFLMGEGAAMLVLEEYEHAKARGAKIYGEVIGYGLSGDAYHITSPAQDGNGGYRAMEMAMKRAGVKPEDIDYINTHGTSTPAGDVAELQAIKRLFGNAVSDISISSTKSSIGHLLGAAGSAEAIFSLKAINEDIVPPTLNLDNPAPEAEGLDLVPHKAKKRDVKAALSNSFGFGGTNATLIFREV